MPLCTRSGCKQEYESGSSDPCVHHSGLPVFHEGLKSWSCCNETNKPVLDFESFVRIPGCTEAETHTDEKPQAANASAKAAVVDDAGATALKMTPAVDGVETYTSTTPSPALPSNTAEAIPSGAVTPVPVVEEDDDLSAPVPPGTTCKRNGCNVSYVDDATSRTGDGDGATCLYHPAPPLFREGSKGYLCCKKRVLEFDEFLKIAGCKKGAHLFVPKGRPTNVAEFVTCRVDHYQTPKEVYVSVFAKKADKDKSTVHIEDSKVTLDILMPSEKRFQRTLELFGPVDVSSSSYQILGTKVEIKLVKLDGRSWNVLEKPAGGTPSLNLTFGVGGRTGTVGGKSLVLDAANQSST